MIYNYLKFLQSNSFLIKEIFNVNEKVDVRWRSVNKLKFLSYKLI